jgi:hypothetical protein
MPHVLTREVAEVRLAIGCEGMPLRETPAAWPAGFACDGLTSQDSLFVRLQVGDLPDLTGWPRIFLGGGAWALYGQGASRLLCSDPPELTDPVWIARWQGDAAEVVIDCSPRMLTNAEDETTIIDPVSYPLDQVLITHFLARRQGLLIHAAGVEIQGRGLLFAGRSGAGKSTITRQFMAQGYTGLLSDDRVIVRKQHSTYRAYGTPWPGDAGVAANASTPLSAIFFLRHGSVDRIRSLAPQLALERLMPVTSVLWYEPALLGPMLDTCEDLVHNVPAFDLEFMPSAAVIGDLADFVTAHL